MSIEPVPSRRAMYEYTIHKELGLLIAVMNGDAHGPEQWDRMIVSMQEIDALCLNRPVGFLSIMEVDPSAPRPDPNIRRRMGEHKQQLRSPQRLMAVVTESALIRGAATALKWISPPP